MESTTIGFRVNPEEEVVVRQLAEHLERNVSDAVRFAVRRTAREYGLIPTKKNDEEKAQHEHIPPN